MNRSLLRKTLILHKPPSALKPVLLLAALEFQKMSNELTKTDQSCTSWRRRCDRCGGVEPEVADIARLFRADLPIDLYPWRWVCGDCIDAVVDALGLWELEPQ